GDEDALVLGEALGHFDLHSIRETDSDGPLFRFTGPGIDDDRVAATAVAHERPLREEKHVLSLLEDDERVRGHVRKEEMVGIIDRDPNLEGDDPVRVLETEGSDAQDAAGKHAILEALDGDPRGEIAAARARVQHAADVDLVHLAFDVDLAEIAERHDHARVPARYADRRHGIAFLEVAIEDDAVDRRDERRLFELLARDLGEGAHLLDASFGRGEPRASDRASGIENAKR